jgi:hypothetical protein
MRYWTTKVRSVAAVDICYGVGGGVVSLRRVYVAEPPELFQLKCPSHASKAATHLNRNKPSVPQIQSDKVTYLGSNTTSSLEGESQKKYNKTGKPQIKVLELLHKSEFFK